MKQRIKKWLVPGLVGMMLLGTTFTSFAGFHERLEGHWSQKLLKENTVSEYFPMRAANDFAELLPKKEMMRSEVIDALNRLYEKYGKTGLMNPENAELIKRKEILELLKPALMQKDILPKPKREVFFEDWKEMKPEERQVLGLLVEKKILNGISETRFAPDRGMTQSEVMIVVQRLDRMMAQEKAETQLQTGKEVPFRLLGQSQSYNDSEGFSFHDEGEKIRLSVTKRFPTPGYTLTIDKILVGTEGLLVKWHADTPGNMIVPQVITYQTVSIEILKSDLPKDAPMNVFVEGFERNDM